MERVEGRVEIDLFPFDWTLRSLIFVSQLCLTRRKEGRGWIDSLRVYVKAGTGGTGLPRLDGVGGHGGNVYVRASDKIESLHEVRRKNKSQRYLAESGECST